MGFFHYDFENSKGRISISEQAWVYLALALPLTVLTLGLSYAWIWWKDKGEQNTHGFRLYSPERLTDMSSPSLRKKRIFPFSLFTQRNTSYPVRHGTVIRYNTPSTEQDPVVSAAIGAPLNTHPPTLA